MNAGSTAGETHYRFRGHRQRAAVCRRILTVAGLADLWTEEGPGSEALRALIHGNDVPAFEALFVLAAWTVWADEDVSRLTPAFERLDARLARGISALDCVLRADAGAIDAWLAAGGIVARPWPRAIRNLGIL